MIATGLKVKTTTTACLLNDDDDDGVAATVQSSFRPRRRRQRRRWKRLCPPGEHSSLYAHSYAYILSFTAGGNSIAEGRDLTRLGEMIRVCGTVVIVDTTEGSKKKCVNNERAKTVSLACCWSSSCTARKTIDDRWRSNGVYTCIYVRNTFCLQGPFRVCVMRRWNALRARGKCYQTDPCGSAKDTSRIHF